MLRARQKIGKYRILGRVASGPLADVYRALDTIQNIKVALKIPKKDDQTGHEEFLHEVRVATKLKHPNILPVLNASYIDGHFVIAMELGGESLADRIERRTSTARALDLAGQGLAALAHAHDHNIIHCDIKPENFILFAGNRLKLGDFGFAKLSVRTIKASGSGTIDYIAPEQAMGRPKFQSDVFSMGLVLYRMFSGTLPEWPFDWPMAGHDKLSARVRPELIEILRKAIQLDPAKRYRDAVQMQSDFERSHSHARKQKRPKAKNGSRQGTSWRQLQWREFQRQFRKVLDTRHHCRRCEGPVSESMQACPWCGFDNPARGSESRMPSSCPRCERGVKNDWDYCAWCYGQGFVEETTRHYPDKRYSARCANQRCREPLMPFMRYCPWCRVKVRRPWKLKGSKHSCKACKWGIAREFWNYCAWCREPVRRE
ncbi:MAG: serine/threonine protein kinase [Gammaproteobacteria bacterium]|nr:serine/threonine protein kinase [Gammaproteobacteria bacterium]MBT8109723.1 serine/threonine protein kinase [Gammaproteobacteria bacterium]NND48279.1 serine/threonine protein kinase [Woeseiaceae bacterium]NNL44425.1 serine/threonine protein kinase [Woeseiaceae bacterium]